MAKIRACGTTSELKIRLRVKPNKVLECVIESVNIPKNKVLENAYTYKDKFMAQLEMLGEFERLDIIIDSRGGSLDSAWGLVDALYAMPGKARVLIDGQCGSAATMIPAGIKGPVFITERSSVYIHGPQAAPNDRGGKIFALYQRFAKKWSTKMMVKFYRTRIKKPRKTIRQWMENGTRFSPKEAVEVGFCDGIMSRYEFERCR